MTEAIWVLGLLGFFILCLVLPIIFPSSFKDNKKMTDGDKVVAELRRQRTLNYFDSNKNSNKSDWTNKSGTGL